MARYPAQLNRELSRKKNTAIGGDGAIVRGGPEARHISTKAAERKLCRLSKCDGDPPVLDQDSMHHDEAARRRAFKEVLMWSKESS